MENAYEKVVKLTAEILKSWTSNPGVVSPFSSSSSQHEEISDSHLEHYVPKQSTEPTADISSIFNSDLFTNGGEKMTEKTLDVNASTTTDTSYTNASASTTEPDAESQIAITKSVEIPHTEVGTTANTTTEAPAGGDTTEPMTKAAANCPTCGGDACPDCNQAIQLCKCSGMTKADESKETPADEAKETPAEEAAEAKAGKEEPMKKSLWGGQLAPRINGKL